MKPEILFGKELVFCLKYAETLYSRNIKNHSRMTVIYKTCLCLGYKYRYS